MDPRSIINFRDKIQFTPLPILPPRPTDYPFCFQGDSRNCLIQFDFFFQSVAFLVYFLVKFISL